MKKPKTDSPRWIVNLRTLMQARDLNPRSLSLKAGLNPTAVRDMLEGRTRFPRYDTVLALAKALGVTSPQLMGGSEVSSNEGQTAADEDDDLDLLTEIITRLQEVAENYQHQLNPRDFAAMVTTIYRRVRQTPAKKTGNVTNIKPQAHDLMAYEALRRRVRG